jgi:transcriptional regulator with GAF, ATPase, and Fis domain
VLTNGQPASSELDALLGIARDLTASLLAKDRYARLLGAVRRLIPCDAACLLRLEGEELVPMAGYGLTSGALSRRYRRRDHPRLDIILGAGEPVRSLTHSTADCRPLPDLSIRCTPVWDARSPKEEK